MAATPAPALSLHPIRSPRVLAAYDALTRETERIAVLARLIASEGYPDVTVLADLIEELVGVVNGRADALAAAVERRRVRNGGAA